MVQEHLHREGFVLTDLWIRLEHCLKIRLFNFALIGEDGAAGFVCIGNRTSNATRNVGHSLAIGPGVKLMKFNDAFLHFLEGDLLDWKETTGFLNGWGED